MTSFSTKNAFLSVAVILLLLYAVWHWQSGSLVQSGSSRLPRCEGCNVAVIVIDTLRADRLPFYGYEKDTAPFLASLAEKSILFESAISSSSTTAPATASLFTGRYPSRHGVITGFIATSRLQNEHSSVILNKIPDELETMPELFKRHGYRTFGVSDNLNVCSEMGFDQGFDRLETFRYEGAERVNEVLRGWQGEIAGADKSFVYAHYMDPHKPYNRREPWYKPASSARGRIQNAYDSEISYVDMKIKEMFELFGWDDNTVVVVVSDHGEEFWEHGGNGHGRTLYREVIHVPFLFYVPGEQSRRIPFYVPTYDLLPTLAEIVGFEHDPAWEAESLVPMIEGDEQEDRIAFSELLSREEHRRPTARSVVDNGWHYIELKPKKADWRYELFNMKTDPTEQVNLLDAEREKGEGLREILQDFAAGAEERNEEIELTLDEETYDSLKTLGYVD